MSMLLRTYRFLKTHRISSSILQSLDVITRKKLKSHTHKIYVRAISNHWIKDSYEREIRDSFLIVSSKIGAKTFVDIGANVGIFSLDFLSDHPERSAAAVEPNHLVFSCLKKTSEAVREKRMQAYNIALSNYDGTVDLTFDPLAPSRGGIVPMKDNLYNHEIAYKGHSHTQRVNCLTLDTLIQKLHFKPDIIKIDAEGAELLILEGGKKTLSNDRPALLIECNRDIQEIEALLTSHGYLFYNIKLKRIAELEWMVFAIHPKSTNIQEFS